MLANSAFVTQTRLHPVPAALPEGEGDVAKRLTAPVNAVLKLQRV